MAGDGKEPRPAKRDQLAAELRRVRELRGMSGRDLAQHVQISQSKVSRIESGRTVPTLPEVAAWAHAVEVGDDQREWLIALAESVYTEVHSWSSAKLTRTHVQDEIEEREMHARVVRHFQSSVVPGLLQTAEYARRAISMGHLASSVDAVAESLAGRLRRQLVVYEEGRRFDFVITEAALRWRPGPAKLLLAQFDRIATLSTLDNVSIGVIPLDTEATTYSGHSFVIYDDHDDERDPFVEAETIHANLIVNDAAHVRLYQERWSLLCDMALFGEDARALLTGWAAAIRAHG